MTTSNSADAPSTAGSEGAELPALFRWYPQLRERIAWLPLGRFPTPVHPLRVGAIGSPIFVKRDDLAGDLYGGNKVRKLEFILADARRQRIERLITAGAAGSHHALATAVYGRLLGLRTTLVLFPQPLTPHVRDVLLLAHAHGAEVRFVSRMEAVPLGLRAARLAHRDERLMTIPPGGSDTLGSLGYVSAALEMIEQIRDGSLPTPASVHLAAGTLGTTVGLMLGLTLAGAETGIAATRITSRLLVNRWTLRRLARQTARRLQDAGGPTIDLDRALDRLRLSHRQIGPGYGHPTRDAERAAEVLGSSGLVLDPTYTAKAAVDFLDAAQLRKPDEATLFWHTLSATVPEPPADAPPPESLPAEIRRYLLLDADGSDEGRSRG